jgi:hypothetical protein
VERLARPSSLSTKFVKDLSLSPAGLPVAVTWRALAPSSDTPADPSRPLEGKIGAERGSTIGRRRRVGESSRDTGRARGAVKGPRLSHITAEAATRWR